MYLAGHSPCPMSKLGLAASKDKDKNKQNKTKGHL
jgi:hypothetical protein